MATCPSCGKEQPGSSAFCSACGAVLDRPNIEGPPPPTTLASPPVEPQILLAPSRDAHDFGDIGQYIARRLFALIVDLIGIGVLFAVAIAYVIGRRGGDTHSFGGFFEAAIYTLFVLIVYKCITEAYLGTTLGKALMALRVRATRAEHVGIGSSVVRNIFLPFDLLVIGFVLAALTPRRRRIGDFVAGTEVVNSTMPALSVALAFVLIGAWGYAEYAYADGLRTAQTLENAAATYGPGLIGGQAAPPAVPTPLPQRTPVPTEQPITVPTIPPSGETPSSETPAPGASPTESATDSASPTMSPNPLASGASTPAASPASPAQTPSPTSTTS